METSPPHTPDQKIPVMRILLPFFLLMGLALPTPAHACCAAGVVYVHPYGPVAANTQWLINFHARDYFPAERLAQHPLTFVLHSQQGLEIGVSVVEAFQSAGSYTQLLLRPHCDLTLGDSLRLKVLASDTLFLAEQAYQRLASASAQAWEEARKRRRSFQASVQGRSMWVQHPVDRVPPRFPDSMSVQATSGIGSSTGGHSTTFTFPRIAEPTKYLLYELHLAGRKAYCFGTRQQLRLAQNICGANIRLEDDHFYELKVVPMDFAGNRSDPLIWSFWTASHRLASMGWECSGGDAAWEHSQVQQLSHRLDTLAQWLAARQGDSAQRAQWQTEQRVRRAQLRDWTQRCRTCDAYRQGQLPRQVARQRRQEAIPLLRRL